MADYGYVTSTGVIVPDTDAILDEINAEWRSAFGQDFDVDPSTDQGVIISADVEMRDGVMRNNAALANQVNPDYAGGVFIDALWRLTGGKRRGATFSTIAGVLLTGQTGTLVPKGSAATVTGSGAIFLTAEAVIIGATVAGQATVSMIAQESGPVGAPAGQLQNVATSVLGWETVNNPNAAVVGSLEESDVASRTRRRQTLALQSVAMPEAIISRLYDIPEVKSLQFRENVGDTTAVIDGITLVAHSIWVCVDGGTDTEIATALLATKSMGANWNGAVTVNVVEPASGQTYTVKFDRTAQVVLFVRVTARFNNTDGATIIPNACMAYANGELAGDSGLTTGADVSPFEFGGAVNQVEPRIHVTKVELSTNGTTWSTADLVLPLNQKAVLTASRVLVVAV